VAKIF